MTSSAITALLLSLTTVLSGLSAQINGLQVSPTTQVAQAVTSTASLPLLQSSNLTYVGSFKLPNGGGPDNTGYGYAATSAAYNPANNSLFIVGHDWYQNVGEVSIPAMNGTATVIQALADPFAGRIGDINPTDPNSKKVGALLVSGGKLYAAGWSYYDGALTQNKSHFARSSTSITGGTLLGPVKVGTVYPGWLDHYATLIPTEWQSAFGGTAITGGGGGAIVAGQSLGPSLTVFNPSDITGSSAVSGRLLVGYPIDHNTLGGCEESNKLFNCATSYNGVVFPANSRSVLVFGTLGTGGICYKSERGPTGCRGSGGYQSEGYQPTVFAYDANDLLAVKNGTKQSWEVIPYATWELPGAGDGINGAAYDPATQRIYVTNTFQDGDKPVIRVYQLNGIVGGTNAGSGNPSSSTPTDAVVSAWSAWTDTSSWGTCSSGTQTKTQIRTRTVVTAATNGGSTPALSETQTVSQSCTSTTPSTPTTNGDASTPALSGWSVGWSDEFNGSTVNASIWNVENSNTTTYGGDDQAYLTANSVVSGGYLTLVSKRESSGGKSYTSGAVTTKNKQTFGGTGKDFRLEIKAKLPGGTGVWPALWTREGSMPNPDTGIELDLMELLGHEPSRVYMTHHKWSGGTHVSRAAACEATDTNYTTGYHTYVLEQVGTTLRWYIDGVQKCIATSDLPVLPSYLMMNTSIGGSWPESVGQGINSSTAMPQNFSIDYVRLYVKGTGTTPSTPTPTPTDAVLSSWSSWSATTAWSACVSGTQTRTETRTRTVVTPATNGGTTGALSETRTATQTCTLTPTDAVVSAWSAWNDTTVWSACVNGVQTKNQQRTRTVVTAATNGGSTPALSETQTVSQSCTTSTTTQKLTQDLRLGSRGTQVTILQNFLIKKGYLKSGLNTGYFGYSTYNAVRSYQRANGISATGYVGSQTRTKINAEL